MDRRGDLMTHRLVCNPYLHTSGLFLVMTEALAQPADRFPACTMSRPEPRPVPPACQVSPADVDAMRRLDQVFDATMTAFLARAAREGTASADSCQG